MEAGMLISQKYSIMHAQNNRMKRKRITAGLPWMLLGFMILAGSLYVFFNPPLRSALLGESKTEAPPLDTQDSPDSVSVDDYAALLEKKLRLEYDSILRTELAKEREKTRTSEPQLDEPGSISDILHKPEGIISDIRRLGNDVPLKTEVIYHVGEIAIKERQMHDSYVATYQLQMRVPRPAVSMREIETGTPGLSKILPGFTKLFPQGSVSPWHETLYRNKISELHKKAGQLNTLLSKQNAYDCNTILQLKSEKGRKVFYMQADMDAIQKGSDGDRLPVMPVSQVESVAYDPFTAYQWRKTGSKANPMISGWERRIAIGTKELDTPGMTPERKAWVGDRLAMLKAGVNSMKKRAYLISDYDPYITLPIGILKNPKDPFAPKIGDYAIVIYGTKIYPCIVGDKSPDYLAGEASARIATAINPNWRPGSNVIASPVVSYIVFPGSGETNPEPPDYAKWRDKCGKLLAEIGGTGEGYVIHNWTDPFSQKGNGNGGDSDKPKIPSNPARAN